MNGSKRMILRLALAALLLFAQQVALAHQVAHALDAGSLHSRQAGDFQSKLCVFHGDFESLLSAVEFALPVLDSPGAVFAQLSTPASCRCAVASVVPASRGPPPPLTA